MSTIITLYDLNKYVLNKARLDFRELTMVLTMWTLIHGW